MPSEADLLFGKIVVKNQLATQDQVRECLAGLEDDGAGSLSDLMIRRGIITSDQAEKVHRARNLARFIKEQKAFERAIVEKGLAEAGVVRDALARIRSEGYPRSLGETLVEEGAITEDQRRAVEEEIASSSPQETAVEPETAPATSSGGNGAPGEVGGYPVLGELARTPSGVVYRSQTDEGANLILKLLPPDLAAHESVADRFQREAGRAHQVQHPAVHPAVDVGYVDDGFYYVVSPPQGEPLDKRLVRSGALAPDEAVRLGTRLADGLAACHDAGLMHGAFSPASVILTARDEPVISDLRFGAGAPGAERFGGADVRYLAPEMTKSGASPTARTDVYGLGATLYAMITGRPPFEGPDAEAILARSLASPPTDPREVADVPDRLAGVCQAALAKEPDRRYRDLREMAEDLENALEGTQYVERSAVGMKPPPGEEDADETAIGLPSFAAPEESAPPEQPSSGHTAVSVPGAEAASPDDPTAQVSRSELPPPPHQTQETPAAGSGSGSGSDDGTQVVDLRSGEDVELVEGEDPLVDRTLNERYKIVERIGEGGMGVVYRARHLLMDKEIAFKVLHPDLIQDQESLHRFKREVQATSRFTHDHIVQIYDAGEARGDGVENVYYMAMEFVPGREMTEIIEEEDGLDPGRAIGLVRQTLEAVGAAHDAGIVHRDLKADNLMVLRGEGGGERVKVMDFGIAKMLEQAGSVADGDFQQYKTQQGVVTGTPQYMSPEQASGAQVDHRTDLYSLGIILYEMLAGVLPFQSSTPMGYLGKHIVEPPPPLEEVRPDLDVPEAIEAVIMRALEKDREKRYQSAPEMLDDLERAADEAGVRAPAPAGGGEELSSSFQVLPEEEKEAGRGAAAGAPSSPGGRSSGTQPAGRKKKNPLLIASVLGVVFLLLVGGGGVALWSFGLIPGTGETDVAEGPTDDGDDGTGTEDPDGETDPDGPGPDGPDGASDDPGDGEEDPVDDPDDGNISDDDPTETDPVGPGNGETTQDPDDGETTQDPDDGETTEDPDDGSDDEDGPDDPGSDDEDPSDEVPDVDRPADPDTRLLVSRITSRIGVALGSPTEAREYLDRAEENLESYGGPREAEFRRRIDRVREMRARYVDADAALETGSPEEAADHVREATRLARAAADDDPGLADALQEALEVLGERRTEVRSSLMERARARLGSDPAAAIEDVRLARELGEDAESRRLLDRARYLDRRSQAVELRENDPDEALRLLREALEFVDEPSDEDRDLEEELVATIETRERRRRQEEQVADRLSRAEAHRELGDWAAAVEELEAALEVGLEEREDDIRSRLDRARFLRDVHRSWDRLQAAADALEENEDLRSTDVAGFLETLEAFRDRLRDGPGTPPSDLLAASGEVHEQWFERRSELERIESEAESEGMERAREAIAEARALSGEASWEPERALEIVDGALDEVTGGPGRARLQEFRNLLLARRSVLADEEVGFIAPGPFFMGDPHPQAAEPGEEATTEGFFVGLHEVTQAEWAEFCEATGREPPVDGLFDEEQGDLPIRNVTYRDIEAYCAWRTDSMSHAGLVVRPPTEAEWEKTARGSTRNVWPWGDDFRAYFIHRGDGPQGVGKRAPGDADHDSFRVHNLGGNVAEWTSTPPDEPEGAAATDGFPGGSWSPDAPDRESPANGEDGSTPEEDGSGEDAPAPEEEDEAPADDSDPGETPDGSGSNDGEEPEDEDGTADAPEDAASSEDAGDGETPSGDAPPTEDAEEEDPAAEGASAEDDAEPTDGPDEDEGSRDGDAEDDEGEETESDEPPAVRRVVKGGSFRSEAPTETTIAARRLVPGDEADDDIGFRIVIEVAGPAGTGR